MELVGVNVVEQLAIDAEDAPYVELMRQLTKANALYEMNDIGDGDGLKRSRR